MTERNWRLLFGALGIAIAIILGQDDVPLDPIFKLALTVAAGVIAFIKAPDSAA